MKKKEKKMKIVFAYFWDLKTLPQKEAAAVTQVYAARGADETLEWHVLFRPSCLQVLELQFNCLTELPDIFGLLPHLRTLLADSNLLEALPPSVWGLSKLETLSLNNNKLRELPAEIGNLTSLKSLYVRGNFLTELPGSIAALGGLETLDAGNNRLEKIPRGICGLLLLEVLVLDGIPFGSFPYELKGLKNLRWLEIDDTVPRREFLFGDGKRLGLKETAKLPALQHLRLFAALNRPVPEEWRIFRA